MVIQLKINSMTYYAKGYGYHETGDKKFFSCIFDVDEVNAASFMRELEKAAGLNPYRGLKDIVFENLVVLSK